MSGVADLRSRNVSPIFSPVKDKTGSVASWEEIMRGLETGFLRKNFGLLKDIEILGVML